MQHKSKVGFGTVSDCERTDLEKFRPPDEIVLVLKNLFLEKFVERITNLTQNLKPYLIARGFKVLQYPYSSRSAIVVEHPTLAGFVLKFARDPLAASQGKFKGRIQVTKRRSLAARVLNADKLNTFLQQNAFNHVKVPKKYFFCVANRFPVLVAQKFSLETKRGLSDLGEEEILEILATVEFSRGTLDLWPRNIVIVDEDILFIDLERQEEPVLWQTIILESVKEFRARVNPAYRAIVETWFARVSQRGELLDESVADNKKSAKSLKAAVIREDAIAVRQLLKEKTFKATRLDKLLFKAIEAGECEIVGLLLENGANPHIRNKRGFTQTEIAFAQGNRRIIALLKRVGRR